MKNSKLQFDNPKILEIDYRFNEGFIFDKQINMNTNAEVQVNKDISKRAADVLLMMRIFSEEDFSTVPFKLNMSIKTNFQWEPELDSIIDNLLNTNGPAILFSYIRPFVTQFTVFSGLPALVLPAFDFTSDELP